MLTRKLEIIPYDKVFFTDKGEELCHATGIEICTGNPDAPEDWRNEYIDSSGDYHYGR